MRAFVHNYDEARKAAKGKLPVLQFHGGAPTVLLPHGQQVRLDTITMKRTNESGKAARRARIKARRLAREHQAAQ